MQTTEPTSPGAASAPTLAVLRCGSCHGATYPSTAYGCRHCGAEPERGTVEQIPARGILRNYVTVHAELVRDMAPPFVVGEVEVAPGLREEVLLEVASEAELAPGMAVRGVLRADAPGGERFPLRFVPAAAMASAASAAAAEARS